MKIKVRIAPSPTGSLHIGTAQSALYNWLFAKKNDGEFYLRIEDTNKERSAKEYEQSILDALEWLGLKWDGDTVRQSERISKYRTALEKLLSEGKAFYCHHTKEELETERKKTVDLKKPYIHVCEHKNSDKGKQEGGIIRLVGPKTQAGRDVSGEISMISFEDMIRGWIHTPNWLLGDFSIARSLDDPLYNLAVVVDDIDMQISHVIRGEDHISNTPKQMLIYKAIGKKVPQFAHLPLILASDRSKLSKRHGAVAVVDYKKNYLPKAIINFLGAMSFTFSKDILTKDEMIEEFELSKVHKSGAIFDIKKLNWINSQYIKKLAPEEFKKISRIPDIPDSAVPLITERLEKLSDAHDFDYFWKEPEYGKDLLKWKKADLHQSKVALGKVLVILNKVDFEENKLRNVLDELGKELGDRGLAYWPLRVALTGKEKSPDPVEVAIILKKNIVLQRIDEAIQKLN